MTESICVKRYANELSAEVDRDLLTSHGIPVEVEWSEGGDVVMLLVEPLRLAQACAIIAAARGPRAEATLRPKPFYPNDSLGG